MKHQTASLLLVLWKVVEEGFELHTPPDEEIIPDFVALLEISYHLQKEFGQGFAVFLHALKKKEQLIWDAQRY